MPDHIPVLLKETLDLLVPALVVKGDNLPVAVDCTCGCGHHSIELFKLMNGKLKLISLDCDDRMLDLARANFLREGVPEDLFKLIRANFSEVAEAVKAVNVDKVDAVIYDLGLNSSQVDNSARGFSFRNDGPLDMRFDSRLQTTAADIVNNWPAGDLSRLFRDNADEHRAMYLAKVIVQSRKKVPVTSTRQLASIVEDATPQKLKVSGHLHCATKIFQALRIEVNKEYEVLKESLKKSASLLRVHGRIAAISYHSGEDRITKHYFRELSLECKCPQEQPICTCGGRADFKVLTRNPIVPCDEEIANNPRARSAKLRGVEKLYETDKSK